MHLALRNTNDSNRLRNCFEVEERRVTDCGAEMCRIAAKMSSGRSISIGRSAEREFSVVRSKFARSVRGRKVSVFCFTRLTSRYSILVRTSCSRFLKCSLLRTYSIALFHVNASKTRFVATRAHSLVVRQRPHYTPRPWRAVSGAQHDL